jgi:CTP:molybdopterin cytidylyltransferase MocA/ADP-ribose pyrophosphatase YjhB (NUDIX family)
MNVTAIVLAAGTSSRMGQPKQLLPFEGKSLVRRAAEAAIGSKARQTLVVTGAASPQVDAELAGLAVMLVHNDAYAEGMSTSLKAGLRAVRPEVDAVVVLLADQPFISSEIIDGLIDLHALTEAKIVRPRYGGEPGNPVLWDQSLFRELMEQTGDQGGRALLQEYRDEVVWLDLPDARLQTDVDTPEAYANLTGSQLPPTSAVTASDAQTAEVGLAPPDAPAFHERAAASEGTAPSENDGATGGHPHVGGFKFCPRCATPLEIQPVSYDGGREHPVCPNCGFVVWNDPKVAALTLIPWEGGLLLGLRRENPGSGRWSFPSGFVDRGEVVEEAALRETREETGLEVELTGLVGVYSEPGNPVIVIAYAAEVRGGTLQADDDLVELRVFDPDNLPEMAFAHDTRIVRDWQAFQARTTLPR